MASSDPRTGPSPSSFPAGHGRRRMVILIAKALFTVAIAAAVVSRLDGHQVITILGQMDVVLIAGAFVGLALQMGVHVFAWQVLLRSVGINLPAGVVTRIMLLSLFFNQIVPASLGGVGTRVFYTWRENVPFSRAMASVVLDRASFLVTLMCVVIAASPVIVRLSQNFLDSRVFYIFVFLTVAVPFCFLLWGDELLKPWRYVSAVDKGARFLSIIRESFSNPMGPIRSCVLFILYHSFSVMAFWLIATAMGITTSVLEYSAVVVVVLLFAALPITINGWGVREASAVGMFALIGISAEQAVVVASMYGVGVLITRLPMGVLWFRSGLSPRRVGTQ